MDVWDWCGTGVTWIRWIHTRWHHYAQAYPFPVGRTSSPLPLPHDSLQGYGEVGSAVGPITASLTVAPSAAWRGSSAVHGQKRSRRRRGRRLATSGTMRGSLYQVCGSGRGHCCCCPLPTCGLLAPCAHVPPFFPTLQGLPDTLSQDKCPYSATPLPVSRDAIALEPHMVIHTSTPVFIHPDPAMNDSSIHTSMDC